MAANHSSGDALSPFERRRLEELRRRLETDDPLLAAALTQDPPTQDPPTQDPLTQGPLPAPVRERRHPARSVLLVIAGTLVTAVVVLGSVVMFGFASVVGVLCSVFTMYGIFKLCATADRSREQQLRDR